MTLTNAYRPEKSEAARHICEEAMVLLSSLRGGPPEVAHGELARGLQNLRRVVRCHILDHVPPSPPPPPPPQPLTPPSPGDESGNARPDETCEAVTSSNDIGDMTMSSSSNLESNSADGESDAPIELNCPPPELQTFTVDIHPHTRSEKQSCPPPRNPPTPEPDSGSSDEIGPYAQPFLSVVMDPRAAGPHTLVALRALYRLLERKSLTQTTSKWRTKLSHKLRRKLHHDATDYTVSLEPLLRGVLQCKFEQTDAGADEAVEMAIADLLSLIVTLDASIPARDITLSTPLLQPPTLMEAFHTVFVTRNTFVHSPALCYHYEEVLTTIASVAFSRMRTSTPTPSAARLVMSFLVQQLLHTPLTSGSGGSEAQTAHDATRVLSLRLARQCLRTGWGDYEHLEHHPSPRKGEDEQEVLHIVQDELCLSLLMMGQAFWENRGEGLSLEVLSEICSTISLLWSISYLRSRLVPQFEAIFSGFFQRALILLRKRSVPRDSVTYHSNFVFDSEAEILLQALVDILCLQDVGITGRGALETLYAMYDCNDNRSDVAAGLIVELCRCCGGMVGQDGEILEEDLEEEEVEVKRGITETLQRRKRQVPAHLKELCAEALVGSLKCLFRDIDVPDQEAPENETLGPRRRSSLFRSRSSSNLRKIKQKKRLMRHGAILFNKGSTLGLEFLSNEGVLPKPVTPKAVAKFLREGLVVGLDKSAVGLYLGEVGKGPVPGKNPHNFERDWFHRQALEEYCALFRFENQSLLDGLRMFLSSFRLPGEAQQIDRILQAFSENCSQQCEEAADGRLKYFSENHKKSADAAYLLAFSVIMLNTDLHNDNIRPDKKMSIDAFVKNNTDYGRDITDEGKELPREFLEKIYESIREEELRTEGEGADGTMTVERWKDVLRGVCGRAGFGDQESFSAHNQYIDENDSEGDLKCLVVESLWHPILGAIGGLWNLNNDGSDRGTVVVPEMSGVSQVEGENVMHGSQGARLGMDLATELVTGVRVLGRKDIFQKVFVSICKYSGLLLYKSKAVTRMSTFVRSVERQSAVVVAMNTAIKAGNDIGVVGWKCVWGIVFELRDLKLLGGGRRRGLLSESDSDLLSKESRHQWTNKLLKGGVTGNVANRAEHKSVSSVFVAMGRALFGADDFRTTLQLEQSERSREKVKTVHEKENLLLWHDLAPSDEEEEYVDADVATENFISDGGAFLDLPARSSTGAAFESQIMREDRGTYPAEESGDVERIEARSLSSQRARVRRRLANTCDFVGLISESRFFSHEGTQELLEALIDLIRMNNRRPIPAPERESLANETKQSDEPRTRTEFNDVLSSIVLSPASEALAEILICEISLKNRDRFAVLWESQIASHYRERLGYASEVVAVSNQIVVAENREASVTINPGIEKCVTGLLRIGCYMVYREEVANRVLAALKLLYPPKTRQMFACHNMGRHMAEGLWRICRNVDGLQQIGVDGWDGLLGLVEWCATKGGTVVRTGAKRGGLAEDDPALKAYRSLHLMLHSAELKNVVPFSVVGGIRALVKAGEQGKCAKLCVAGLDLLLVLHNRLEMFISSNTNQQQLTNDDEKGLVWVNCWLSVLDGIAEAAEKSNFPSVRQHALSMLTDAIIDNHGRAISCDKLCDIVNDMCIPLAGKRITALLGSKNVDDIWEEVMIELEVCISLIFKPFLHHLKNLIDDKDQFFIIWKSLLEAMTLLLGDEIKSEDDGDETPAANMTMEKLLMTTQELASEHLRNAVMVLIACGVLAGANSFVTQEGEDLSLLTWDAIENMEFCKKYVEEWKQSANGTFDGTAATTTTTTTSENGAKKEVVKDVIVTPVTPVEERKYEETALISSSREVRGVI